MNLVDRLTIACLIVLSLLMLAIFGAASVLHPPLTTDSRDVFVVALGVAGAALSVLAVKMLRNKSDSRAAHSGNRD
jgi:hypothetical protein